MFVPLAYLVSAPAIFQHFFLSSTSISSKFKSCNMHIYLFFFKTIALKLLDLPPGNWKRNFMELDRGGQRKRNLTRVFSGLPFSRASSLRSKRFRSFRGVLRDFPRLGRAKHGTREKNNRVGRGRGEKETPTISFPKYKNLFRLCKFMFTTEKQTCSIMDLKVPGGHVFWSKI